MKSLVPNHVRKCKNIWVQTWQKSDTTDEYAVNREASITEGIVEL